MHSRFGLYLRGGVIMIFTHLLTDLVLMIKRFNVSTSPNFQFFRGILPFASGRRAGLSPLQVPCRRAQGFSLTVRMPEALFAARFRSHSRKRLARKSHPCTHKTFSQTHFEINPAPAFPHANNT